MRTLFVAWQSPTPLRAWFPIGRLDVDLDPPLYTFRYTRGAIRAKQDGAFRPLMAFPHLQERYESPELFPLFSNRVLSPGRREFSDYVRWLGLDQKHPDPVEILAVSGGERQTDSLEIFPRIVPDREGRFVCRFFVHGLRHLPDSARRRAAGLREGEALQVAVEINNPVTRVALQLQTNDYYLLGWTPRYLVSDFLEAIAGDIEIAATVVRANEEESPMARRVLVQFSGRFPQGKAPMSGPDFEPLAPELAAAS